VSEVLHRECPGCGAPVLLVEDVDTGEPLVVDADPVDEGHVTLWTLKGFGVARRYGAPARFQPAHREHDCPSPTAEMVARVVPDPYEDAPAAVQQHGGWRQ